MASAQFEIAEQPQLSEISLRQYLMSIIQMPKSMKMLCLTNLFCWMSLVCYSLYFTDFVGEAVFGGDPKVPLHHRLTAA
jgi:solute carrier family 45 protein 1/2/4